MTLSTLLNQGVPPIVAILRGIDPEHVNAVGEVLVGAGIRIIEVPLNSPQAFRSIEQLAATLPPNVLIGAGTVTRPDDVDRVVAAGGRLIVAPNTDSVVIARSVACGIDVMPGVLTPTEAFVAHAAGARHVKLFPASTCGTSHLKALREVLPQDTQFWAVGGTGALNIAQWLAVGAVGIGVGGALYRPGDTVSAVATSAAALVAAWRAVKQ